MRYALVLAFLLGCDGDLAADFYAPRIDGPPCSAADADLSNDDGGINSRGDGGGAAEVGCSDGGGEAGADGGTEDVLPPADGGAADVEVEAGADGPRVGCDYLSQTGCDVGEACDPSCVYRPTVCRAAGTLTQDEPCIKMMPYGSNCAAGYICASNSSGAFCRKLCSSSEMCPTGTTCVTSLNCAGALPVGRACH